ncbi:hypothetical protein [Streptomyces sp. NPDC002825]|uniref:hypothetical protein n=1 Tax=Streptomyces sp. NPDC002825 TaxID=3154666 RepID=UPI00331B739C
MCPEPGYRRAPPAGDGTDGVPLLWVRHAKAVRKDRRIDDFDREPSERGRGTLPGPAAGSRAPVSNPNSVPCSPSRRTRQTWQLAASAAGGPAARPGGDGMRHPVLIP